MARVINVDQLAGADQRLYGMMQHLMAAYAQQQAPEKPDPRGVVELQDALDAVIQLAAVIDEETQAGRIRLVTKSGIVPRATTASISRSAFGS